MADWPRMAVQAVQVRRGARRLSEAAGARTGGGGAGAPLDLLIAGDSSAAGVGVPTLDQALPGRLAVHLGDRHRVRWTVVARCGWKTSDVLARLSAMAPVRADVAITCLGVNDVTKGVPMRAWLARQARLWDLLESWGAKRILVNGMPPLGQFPLLPEPLRRLVGARAERFDASLRDAVVARPSATYVPLEIGGPEDMAEDGYHPGPRIYDAWAERLAGLI